MKATASITEYSVVDRIINHLKLTFVAEKPPQSHVFEQVALMAAEESRDSFPPPMTLMTPSRGREYHDLVRGNGRLLPGPHQDAFWPIGVVPYPQGPMRDPLCPQRSRRPDCPLSCARYFVGHIGHNWLTCLPNSVILWPSSDGIVEP